MKNLKVFSGILACLLALGLALTACSSPDSGGTPSTDIAYTVVQTGGTASTADSTGIVFTFSSSVDSLNLTAADITVGGAASKGQAVLSGTGSTRTLSPITVNSAGLATVKIIKPGIEEVIKNVTVHKAGESAHDLTYTVEQTGGVGGVTTTTGIVFSFDGSVDTLGLTAADITVGGTAAKGSAVLSGTGSTRTLSPITVNSAGQATVRITKPGIETEIKNVTVYKAGEGVGHTHNWGPWTATEIAGTQERVCGSNPAHIEARLTGTGRFTFEIISGAAAYRVRKGTATTGTVRIPTYYRPSDEGEYVPVTEIGSSAFRDCTSLTGIHIPESITEIGNSAFSGCGILTGVTIPESVTAIGSSAFSGCESLTGSISIPAGVTSIGSGAFSDCGLLTGITVAANNPSYAGENGILYDKAKTTLIQAPGAISGSPNIPATVTSIDSYAFSGCTSITGITIPSTVASVGSYAFSGWTSSQTIYVHYGSQAAADSAWGAGWRTYCDAAIVYYGIGAAITAPVWREGSAVSLTAPQIITLPSGQTVTAQGWQISDTGTSGWTNFTPPSTAAISHNGKYLRYYATSSSGQTYYSNTVSIRVRGINLIEMVQIPAGTFTMGSPSGEANRYDDETQHTVTLSAFKMGIYEVTQEEYMEVMGTNPSSFTSSPATGEVQGKRPVERVSWYDVLVFCNKLSMMENLTPAYRINNSTDPAAWGSVPTSSNSTWNAVEIVSGSTGYRLPTEAQWEYACRAGTTTAYNTGNTISNNTGWYSSNSGDKTHEVGKKPANAWGLYDMHGNVWEWCWDWYGTYSSGAQTDPVGASSGSNRVGRGGSWNISAEYVRSALRYYFFPGGRSYYLGFRLLRP